MGFPIRDTCLELMYEAALLVNLLSETRIIFNTEAKMESQKNTKTVKKFDHHVEFH